MKLSLNNYEKVKTYSQRKAFRQNYLYNLNLFDVLIFTEFSKIKAVQEIHTKIWPSIFKKRLLKQKAYGSLRPSPRQMFLLKFSPEFQLMCNNEDGLEILHTTSLMDLNRITPLIFTEKNDKIISKEAESDIYSNCVFLSSRD